MTIVIKIPDERYKWIKEHKGVTDYSTTQMLYSRVRKGEVLEEPCSDTISRQAVLDESWPLEYPDGSTEMVISASDIVDLPSVHAEPRTGQSKSIPSGLKLKIEREADYQNERVNADIARGMYLALEIIEKWEADHA